MIKPSSLWIASILGFVQLLAMASKATSLSCSELVSTKSPLLSYELLGKSPADLSINFTLKDGTTKLMKLDPARTGLRFEGEVTVQGISAKEGGKVVQVLLRDDRTRFRFGSSDFYSDIYALGIDLATRKPVWNTRLSSIYSDTEASFFVNSMTDISHNNLVLIRYKNHYGDTYSVLMESDSGRQALLIRGASSVLEVNGKAKLALGVEFSGKDGYFVHLRNLATKENQDIIPEAFLAVLIPGTTTPFDFKKVSRLKVLAYNWDQMTLQLDTSTTVDGHPITERQIYSYDFKNDKAQLLSSGRL